MLDSLHHFVLICETGSFTAASRRAHLTQPAISASIHRLEDQLGARLLERLPRGARPTSAGAALLPRAQAALTAAEECRRAVHEVVGLQAGEVRVGGGAIAVDHLLPTILAAYRRRWPGVVLRVREVYTPTVPRRVAAGELDLGIGEAPVSGLVAEPWATDRLVLVAAPDLVVPKDLSHTPVVTFGVGSSLRQALDRVLPDAPVAVELSSVAGVIGLTRAGLGVALMSHAAVAADLSLGTLVPVPSPTPLPDRELVLVHRGADRLPPAAAALRQLLLQTPPSAGPTPNRR
jgi:DNA-binding transcriptional LysR family regulator